jgi:hypothetical protein
MEKIHAYKKMSGKLYFYRFDSMKTNKPVTKIDFKIFFTKFHWQHFSFQKLFCKFRI